MKLLQNEGWWQEATQADLAQKIRAGANINARDENGATPLHHAAKRNVWRAGRLAGWLEPLIPKL